MRQFIDMLREGKQVKKYSFINELGNSIEARVTMFDDDRKEPVKIELIGPDSISEDNVTKQEAKALLKLLGDSFDTK